MKTRSSTPVYSLFQGFYWASSCLVYSYTRVFLMNYGYSASVAGIVLAVGSLAAVLLQPLLSSLMHSKGITLRTVLSAICACGILCGLVMLLPLPAPAVVAFFTLLGIVTNSTMGFLNSAGFMLDAGRGTLNFPVARGVGSVCYALMSKLMSALAPGRGLLVCYLGCALGLMLLSLCLLPRQEPVEAAENSAEETVRTGFISRNRFYLLMLIGQVLLWFQHNVLSGYLYDLAIYCGGTGEEMGTAILIGALAEVPGMILAGVLVKKHDTARLLQLSVVLYCVRFGMFLLFPSLPMLYVTEVMQMVTFSLLIPVFPVFVEDHCAPGDRIRCQTLNAASTCASGFFGYLLGGLLVDSFGVFFTLKVSFFIGLPGAFLLFFFAEKTLRAGK